MLLLAAAVHTLLTAWLNPVPEIARRAYACRHLRRGPRHASRSPSEVVGHTHLTQRLLSTRKQKHDWH